MKYMYISTFLGLWNIWKSFVTAAPRKYSHRIYIKRKKYRHTFSPHTRDIIITYGDVTAGLVLEQLTRNVFAGGTCSRWHLSIVLPVTAGCMRIKSRWCRVCDPRGCNQPRRFAYEQRKIERSPFHEPNLSLSSPLSPSLSPPSLSRSLSLFLCFPKVLGA